MGASTGTLVLQASSNLTVAESSVLAAATNYEKSKVQLDLSTADTLARLGIDLTDAESGKINHPPVVPGVVPASAPNQLTTPHLVPLGPGGPDVPQMAPQPGQQPQNPPAAAISAYASASADGGAAVRQFRVSSFKFRVSNSTLVPFQLEDGSKPVSISSTSEPRHAAAAQRARGVRGCYETQFAVASVEQTIGKQSALGACMTAQHGAEGGVLGSSGRISPSPSGTTEFRNSLVSPGWGSSECPEPRQRRQLVDF